MADHYYRRNADRALVGMMPLTLEERGAYGTIIDLIYSRTNRLVDDDADLCSYLRCDIRVWRRIKARLLELGKIHIEDGFIRNRHATEEINSRKKGGRTGQLPLDLGDTSAELPANLGRTYGPTCTPKSEPQLSKNKDMGGAASHARANSKAYSNKNIKPLTPLERPPNDDLMNYEKLVLFACWLLGRSSLAASEQQILTEWLEAGYDLNARAGDLERSMTRYRELNHGERPKTLSYFTPMMAQKHRRSS